MATTRYIPRADAEFYVWAANLVNKVAANPAGYGLKPETVTNLQSSESSFDNSFNGSIQLRDAARAAVNQKIQNRKSFEEMIRMVARQIQANPEVSDTEKLEAGLPIHDNQPSPIPLPTSAPTALITASYLRNVIRFADSSNPSRGYRPRGVMGIEIIAHIGTSAPTAMNEYEPMGVSSRMKHDIEFSVADGGKSIWYRFRWIGTSGKLGIWSNNFEATIWK